MVKSLLMLEPYRPRHIIVGLAPRDLQTELRAARSGVGVPEMSEPLGANQLALKENNHLTLRRPYYVDTQNQIEVVRRVAAAGLSPVEVSSSGVVTFEREPGKFVVCLDIDLTAKLRAHHERLIEVLDGLIDGTEPNWEGKGFHPHIGVAYDVDAHAAEILKLTLGKFVLPVNFTLDEIVMLSKIYPNDWDIRTVIARVKLK